MPAYSGRPLAILLAASGFAWVPAAVAATPSPPLVDFCWAPAALAAKPGENVPRKGDHRFDRTPPAVPLAAFAPPPATANGVIRRVVLAGDRKLVALTFDLCEQPGEVAGYDGAIIDYLRKEHIKATFFAGGKWLRSHEERARQLMSDPLFEIGNHSDAHRNLRRLDGQRLSKEILGPREAYEAIRGRLSGTQCAKRAPDAMSRIAPRLTLFRFPYGACNPRSLQAVHDQGLRAIQWDLSTGDPWPAQSAKAIVRTLLAHVRPGSIILAHANGRGWHTAAALPVALPKLRQMGFEFVTVSELLEAGTPVVSQTCFDSRPGDTDHYDVIAHRPRPAPQSFSFFPQ
jgi:peptidoglycan-N-acetylglucosamine deacetylase